MTSFSKPWTSSGDGGLDISLTKSSSSSQNLIRWSSSSVKLSPKTPPENVVGAKNPVFNGERICSHFGVGKAHVFLELEEVSKPAFSTETAHHVTRCFLPSENV